MAGGDRFQYLRKLTLMSEGNVDNQANAIIDQNIPIIKTVNYDKKWANLTILMCTANVGSLFENIDGILPGWLHTFSALVEECNSHIIALHMQEVGGKFYEQSMEHVDEFIKELLSLSCFRKYSRYCVFMNTDFTDQTDFTALGNVYFISNLLIDVSIWNFRENVYHRLNIPIIYSGNNLLNRYANYHKFERSFFPIVKWSRKGFLHTKWRISNSVISFVNIHLFHDASNFGSIQKNESIYTKYRSDALQFTIDRLEINDSSQCDMAVFGDFNFRLNAFEFLKDIVGVEVTEDKIQKNDDCHSKFEITGDTGEVVVIKKKFFSVNKDIDDIFHNNYKEILPYDMELNAFKDIFNEFKMEFPPSYPYSEDVMDGSSFMNTRCPSWCDRVLLTHAFIDRVKLTTENKECGRYGMIGQSICMGDHKGSYLII
ncbi:hypothetical protein GJ496_007211 [Pomphorhynchus laevis]|nr:hypothetical protein GJ496_007211 [Pomphorhynchus laevis]